MSKLRKTAFVLPVLALLLSACAAPAARLDSCPPEAAGSQNSTELIIGTGGTGGVFYPYGEGLASILTANMPGVTVSSIETGGSVDNMHMVQNGEIQIGMSTVDSAYDAILGQAAYAETSEVPACALAVLYTSFVHVVATQASGIHTVADMQGKVVSVGDLGSSTAGAADRVLAAAGLNPETDIVRQNLSISDATAAMTAGSIDAFFWIGGLPTKAVSDMLAVGTQVTFVDASEYVQPLVEQYGPVYAPFTLSKDVYGTEADVPGIGIGNILFVNQSMSTDQAYQILAAMFDHLDEVHAVHSQAASLTLENATQGSSIPFHPGAVQFFKDRGVTP